MDAMTTYAKCTGKGCPFCGVQPTYKPKKKKLKKVKIYKWEKKKHG